MIVTIAWLSVAAFAAGFIDSIAGGGGLISVPALLAANFPPAVVLGTNKFQSTIGTSFALFNFNRKKKVIWSLVLVGLPFALISSIIGSKLTLYLNPDILAKILIFLLPPAAILTFLSKGLIKNKDHSLENSVNAKKIWPQIIIISSIVGFYDGFYGPGTGTFLIVGMVLLAKIPLINASANAKAFNLVSNAGSFITFLIGGYVYFTCGIFMAVANILGNLVGSHFAIKKGNTLVNTFVIISLSLLFSYLVILHLTSWFAK